MSLDIWMRCEGPNRVAPIAIEAWRVVEAQHKVSTRKLVDTLEEQAILEDIVDQVKPRMPTGNGFDGLHYLLSTPFRHPPLRHGSRFGSAKERSIWYGAEHVETSLAEKSYYQLLFVQGTKADLMNLSCDWSAFPIGIASERGVDLTSPYFAEFRSAISSPSTYGATQKLGADMRSSGVSVFTFSSARCPQHGKVVGLFEPAFITPNPGGFQTWKCIVTAEGCEVVYMNGPTARHLAFKTTDFNVDGKLPAPSTS